MVTNLGIGTGRRKNAVARVYIRNGTGAITVNGKALDDYFNLKEHSVAVKSPLIVTTSEDKFDILINVYGGGISGQAGACRHGIARALCQIDEANVATLRKSGFLTRDPRMVERKKYGQAGARRRFQFSKR